MKIDSIEEIVAKYTKAERKSGSNNIASNASVKVTFLIGNGFDLNCGMKTAYKNMYDEYVKIGSGDADIRKFKESLRSYDTWADFEWGMLNHMPEFDSADSFLKCLRDFRDYMVQHLTEQEKQLSSQLEKSFPHNEMDTRMVELIGQSIKQFRMDAGILDRDAEFTFVSFNFTTVLDSYLKKYGKVIHVHGTLDNSPALGIDNTGQFEPNELTFEITDELKRAFVKSVLNRHCFNRDAETLSAIAECDIICAYGLSFGKSDQRWLDCIMKALHQNSEKSAYFYNKKCIDVMSGHLEVITEAAERRREELKKRVDQKYHNCVDRIEFPCGHNLFNIGKAIEESRAYLQNKHERIKRRRAIYLLLFSCLECLLLGYIMGKLLIGSYRYKMNDICAVGVSMLGGMISLTITKCIKLFSRQ
ncbi:MAG: hypothetical protein II871_04010 [Clostridia bacterium]|nr:hypothetical protein [Clostridia bacterium]